MDFSLISLPNKRKQDCVVYGVFSNEKIATIDKKLGINLTFLKNAISDIQKEDFCWTSFYHTNNTNYYFINCGEKQKFSADKLNKIVTKVCNYLLEQKFAEATIALPQVLKHSADWQIEKMIINIEDKYYQLLDFKTKDKKPHKLEKILFNLEDATEAGIASGVAIASGVKLTKTLGDLPANICTPTYLSKQISQLSKDIKSINCKTLSKKEMQKMGMNLILAVGQGSSEEPQLIEIKYTGAKSQDPIVLVGKGITFDSGGISLKPPAGMEEMKYDMCGAASVVGTIKAAALLELPINIVGVIACAENMPGGSAVKPGDVVTSYSGQTVEITNTDAEGRLVLADALTYVERHNPKFVIDIATLTGAVIIALGKEFSGLMTNDDKLANCILQASEKSLDKTWRLPLDPSFDELLTSGTADINHCPAERVAGTVVAATFLAKFTQKYRWAHLDIAGTAWVSGKNRRATGRPVPLLIELMREAANAS